MKHTERRERLRLTLDTLVKSIKYAEELMFQCTAAYNAHQLKRAKEIYESLALQLSYTEQDYLSGMGLLPNLNSVSHMPSSWDIEQCEAYVEQVNDQWAAYTKLGQNFLKLCIAVNDLASHLKK